MLKVDPHPDYPPEEGRYLRGNDKSPVAVIVILITDEDKIPKDIEDLVRAGAEAGAALSGTVQTPNIGFEKIVCNIIANPNIRYVILTGPESPGHNTGAAFKDLFNNGVTENKKIKDTKAAYATLYNLPVEWIDRFRKQVTLIDLHCKGTKESIRQAVWSCYQEEPVDFNGCKVYDTGAYPEAAISGKITNRIKAPWSMPEDSKEEAAVNRMHNLVEKLKKRNKDRNKN